MTDHPETLLAEYVEGRLEAEDRAAVEAHLETCDRCREEVALATEARAAVGSMPDVEAPAGLPLAVRRRARRGSRDPWRLVGAVAAAVVLLGGLVFAFTGLDLGGAPGGQRAAESGEALEATAEEPAPAPQQDADVESGGGAASALTGRGLSLPEYVETKKEYTGNSLAPLARALRDEARAALDAGLPPTARAFFRDFDPAAFTVPVRQAIRCVLAEVPPQQLIVPYRIEAASFQGSPAYVAAFLQGPTPDDPYDRIVIWVVDRATCGLRSLAHHVL